MIAQPTAMDVSPSASMPDEKYSLATLSTTDDSYTYASSSSANTEVTFSTIASNPSTIATNISIVSVEKDDDDHYLPNCVGWLPCGGDTDNVDDDNESLAYHKKKSSLYNSRSSPYSSQLYRRRRRGENRNRTARYLAKFAAKPEELHLDSPKAWRSLSTRDEKTLGDVKTLPKPDDQVPKRGRGIPFRAVFRRFKEDKEKKKKTGPYNERELKPLV